MGPVLSYLVLSLSLSSSCAVLSCDDRWSSSSDREKPLPAFSAMITTCQAKTRQDKTSHNPNSHPYPNPHPHPHPHPNPNANPNPNPNPNANPTPRLGACSKLSSLSSLSVHIPCSFPTHRTKKKKKTESRDDRAETHPDPNPNPNPNLDPDRDPNPNSLSSGTHREYLRHPR